MDSSFFYTWRGRVLYIGNLPELPLHTHAAAAVCVGLDEPITIQTQADAPWSHQDVALIPPRSPHALRTGRAAFLFLDPGSPFYEPLFASASDTAGNESRAWDLESARELREHVIALDAPDLEPDEREYHLSRIPLDPNSTVGLEELAADSLEAVYGDERIARVVRAILDAPDEAPPLEDLAKIAEMSPSRLAHLFSFRVGIPIRALRTWFRLKTAVIMFRRGLSLTDAALNAGFYDSPHFARKFREMFGIAPSLILNRRKNIQWYIESEDLTLAMGALSKGG